MSKSIHNKYRKVIDLIIQVTQNVFIHLKNRNVEACFCLLKECQESAIALGQHIENVHGLETKTVKALEVYCEGLYVLGTVITSAQSDENIAENAKVLEAIEALRDMMKNVDTVFGEELENRIEVVFMPYKAAMWDSLESVWIAAMEDPNCDVYVVPMAYYDRNKEGYMETYHYEGNLFPSEVEITHYEEFDLEEHQPDIIYIHNPYDDKNNATSVDVRFYSDKLKRYTNCLVYIPYYSTSGGMAEEQESCPAYYNADYIVIQSEKYRKFFDPELPDEKFLPYGSPKFDRIIRICNNPSEPPADWKEKMAGKKVYFYNTSLGGMLADTEEFIKKMQYVFECFKGREDACILWRPHPLFDSTIASMRPKYQEAFEKLRNYFLKEEIGIYDTTPDITNTIAQCDAYIGDAASSVVSLFGVAGKPVFIVNNRIHHLPEEGDWKAMLTKGISPFIGDAYKVIQGNRLYHSPNKDYHYHYVCDLNEKKGGNYYLHAVHTCGERSYICPFNAQEILIIENENIVERVELVKEIEQAGAFRAAVMIEENLYLIPNKYPAIVKYDTKRGTVDYIKGYHDIINKWIPEEGKWKFGGVCIWKNHLLLSSPTDHRVLAIENVTGKARVWSVPAHHNCGCRNMILDGNQVWMFPHTGTTITRWNPKTMEVKEYHDMPNGFYCMQRPHGTVCMEQPFSNAYFYKNKIYIAPFLGNMFLCLDKETGEIEQWKPFFPVAENAKSDYYPSGAVGRFIWNQLDKTDDRCWFYSAYDAKVYELNFANETYKEVFIQYNRDEVEQQLKGFTEDSDWMKYCCMENAINTLPAFLDMIREGDVFSKEKQLESYKEINPSYLGDCGRKVHNRL